MPTTPTDCRLDAVALLQAQIEVLRLLTAALFQASQNKEPVIRGFEALLDGYCAGAPPDSNLDFLVEVRAQALLALSSLRLATPRVIACDAKIERSGFVYRAPD